MTERPILYSAPMVRALLGGRKTQTRRAVKPQPNNDPAKHHPIEPYCTTTGKWNWVLSSTGHGVGGDPFPCPYGAPGDRLWVREAWRVSDAHDNLPPREIPREVGREYLADGRGYFDGRYRHARFMPRWASRITLEVTGVRVERLQEISQADCVAEGMPESTNGFLHHVVADYRKLWTEINGAESWAANPWVWVIEFKRVTP